MNSNYQRRNNSVRGRGGYGGSRGGGRGGRKTRGRGGRHSTPHHRNNGNNHQFSINDDIVSVEEAGTYENKEKTVRIAVQGCCHGSIERIYDILEACEKRDEKKIDLLICCGDFQALRNTTDFETMAVPPKYRDIGTFHKYYSGVKKAPILTIFVGGNHEASSYLQELYFGGWVAPNIYYLGAAGVVKFRGLRIAGASGIYKDWDYRKGRFEFPPYNNSTLRSVYHVRNVEVARLKCLTKSCTNDLRDKPSSSSLTDIMISHDWPRGVEQHGDLISLLRKKKYFRDEVQTNSLGSPSNEELLNELKPKWWFAAHLHVKFVANYKHPSTSLQSDFKSPEHIPMETSTTTNTLLKPSQVIASSSTEKDSSSFKAKNSEEPKDKSQDDEFIPLPNDDNIRTSFVGLESLPNACLDVEDLTDLMTKFLSLDKCLPRKRHLQIINIPSQDENEETNEETKESSPGLHYDLEWLAILQKTNSWLSCHDVIVPDPDISLVDITSADIQNIQQRLEKKYESTSQASCTEIPKNFALTLQPHGSIGSNEFINHGQMVGNPQTDEFLDLLGLDHIVTVPYVLSSSVQVSAADNFIKDNDSNEINLDSEHGSNDNDPNEIDIDDCLDVKGTDNDSNEINIEDEDNNDIGHVENDKDANEIDIDEE